MLYEHNIGNRKKYSNRDKKMKENWKHWQDKTKKKFDFKKKKNLMDNFKKI